MRSSVGSGLVLTGTQSSSGKSGTVLADAWVPCESTKCSSETGVQPIPPKQPLGVPPIPRGSATPSKSAPKGSAGPLKTATSKDDSSFSRRSPTKMRVDGVLVDVEGFRTTGAPLLPVGPRCHPNPPKSQTGRARRRGT